jgi:L-asparaginase
MATQVFLLKLMPGMNPEIFDFIVGRYKGVVIESFGNGGVPFIGKADILGKIGQLTGAGIIVVITTQCLFEGGDLNLYEVGQKLMKNMVIPAYDMTTEASVTKLMWVLGQTLSFEEAKKLFLSPVNNDITLLAPDTTS